MSTSSSFAFVQFEIYSSIDSSKTIDNPPEVSNIHRLFLKLNRFICKLTTGSSRAVMCTVNHRAGVGLQVYTNLSFNAKGTEVHL